MSRKIQVCALWLLARMRGSGYYSQEILEDYRKCCCLTGLLREDSLLVRGGGYRENHARTFIC